MSFWRETLNKLKVDLKNCFGIEKLDYTFNFEAYNRDTKQDEIRNVIALYAGNGTMKSSFAKTLDLYSKNKVEEIEDRVFKKKVELNIKNDSDAPFSKDDIYVISSSTDKYNAQDPEEISTLLVDTDLKEKYDAINLSISKKQKLLISQLKKSSGLKTKTEDTLIRDILIPNENLLESLLNLEEQITDNYNENLSNIEYGIILNDKTEAFLQKHNVIDHLKCLLSMI